MQIIDGKQVASQVLEEVERDIARLREQGITPGLAVVLVGEDPASQVYVNSKVKILYYCISIKIIAKSTCIVI